MIYREFQNLKLSGLGMGAMRLPVVEGDDGKILKQIAEKPVYTATLVKYAELVCERPFGQGRLTGIEEY